MTPTRTLTESPRSSTRSPAPGGGRRRGWRRRRVVKARRSTSWPGWRRCSSPRGHSGTGRGDLDSRPAGRHLESGRSLAENAGDPPARRCRADRRLGTGPVRARPLVLDDPALPLRGIVRPGLRGRDARRSVRDFRHDATVNLRGGAVLPSPHGSNAVQLGPSKAPAQGAFSLDDRVGGEQAGPLVNRRSTLGFGMAPEEEPDAAGHPSLRPTAGLGPCRSGRAATVLALPPDAQRSSPG